VRAAFVYIVRTSLVKVVDIVGLRRPVLCAGAVHACVVALASPMLALRVPPVHALSVHACVVRALALPMLALRAPAVRALAVRARAVRLRAGRVVCLCSARLHRADFVRRRRRPHFQRKGRIQADLLRHTLDSHFCLHYHLPPVRLTRGSVYQCEGFSYVLFCCSIPCTDEEFSH
jgi:hypothetical protein